MHDDILLTCQKAQQVTTLSMAHLASAKDINEAVPAHQGEIPAHAGFEGLCARQRKPAEQRWLSCQFHSTSNQEPHDVLYHDIHADRAICRRTSSSFSTQDSHRDDDSLWLAGKHDGHQEAHFLRTRGSNSCPGGRSYGCSRRRAFLRPPSVSLNARAKASTGTNS